MLETSRGFTENFINCNCDNQLTVINIIYMVIHVGFCLVCSGGDD